MKHKNCKWCGEELFKSREHECPSIFIENIIQKGDKTKIIIKGENISLKWKDRKIIVFENLK